MECRTTDLSWHVALSSDNGNTACCLGSGTSRIFPPRVQFLKISIWNWIKSPCSSEFQSNVSLNATNISRGSFLKYRHPFLFWLDKFPSIPQLSSHKLSADSLRMNQNRIMNLDPRAAVWTWKWFCNFQAVVWLIVSSLPPPDGLAPSLQPSHTLFRATFKNSAKTEWLRSHVLLFPFFFFAKGSSNWDPGDTWSSSRFGKFFMEKMRINMMRNGESRRC